MRCQHQVRDGWGRLNRCPKDADDGKDRCGKHGKRKAPGSAFPDRRDPDYVAWLKKTKGCVIQDQHVCGAVGWRQVLEVCHLKTRGSGGDDQGNTFMACALAHDEQEGRTKAFDRKYGISLKAICEGYGVEYGTLTVRDT